MTAKPSRVAIAEVVDELPYIRLHLRRAIDKAVAKSLAPLEAKVAKLERAKN